MPFTRLCAVHAMTASGGLQSDAREAIYEEDVVSYVDDSVADEWGDSEHYNAVAVGLVNRVPDSDEEWSSDEEPEEPVPEGHAEVCWLGGYERIEVEPTAELKVIDRAFLHGDLVSRASDALGDQGVVSAVHLDLDLRFNDNSLVKSVNARRVAHVRQFRPGHYVVYGDWVGKIHDVRENVVVRLDNGSECVCIDPDEDELKPQSAASIFSDEEHCPYFPGCPVHASSDYWKNKSKVTWTYGSGSGQNGGGKGHITYRRSGPHTNGVVHSVETNEVTVIWLGAARRNPNDIREAHGSLDANGYPRTPVVPSGSSDRNVPPRAMPASALHPLQHFAHTCFQLGDKVIVPEVSPGKTHRSVNEKEDNESTTHRSETNSTSTSDSSGYDSDFPDVSGADNDTYDDGIYFSQITKTHLESSASAGVAASVCESIGPAGVVNKGLAKWFKEHKNDNDTPRDLLRPCATIVGTRTFVDVTWQDGSKTRRVPAKDLVPLLHLGEHDFWPDQFIGRVADEMNPPLVPGAGSSDSDGTIDSANDIASALGGTVPSNPLNTAVSALASGRGRVAPVGVVERVNSNDRVATVRWLPPDDAYADPLKNTMRWNASEEKWVDFGESVTERPDDREDISVYEIKEDAEYGYRLGDVVVSPIKFDIEMDRRVESGTLRKTAGVGGVVVNTMMAYTELDLYPLDDDGDDDGKEGEDSDESGDSESEYESDYDGSNPDRSDSHEFYTDSDEEDTRNAERKAAKNVDKQSENLENHPLVAPYPDSLTWVGEVVGASNGFVRVAWGDGTITNTHPKHIWVVSHEDDSELGSLLGGSDFESESDGSDASWETLGGNEDENENAPVNRRGVPEAVPVASSTFSGASSFIDPIARAYVERQREEAEFGWLSGYSNRNVNSQGGGGDEAGFTGTEEGMSAANSSAANVSSAETQQVPPVTALTPEEAARAAEALAAAFRDMTGLYNATSVSSATGVRTTVPSDTTAGVEGRATNNDESSTTEIPSFLSIADEDDQMVTTAVAFPIDRDDGSSSSSTQTHQTTKTISVYPSVKDHRFAASDMSASQNNQLWSKTIQKEWKILCASLPDNIFVRVFESRMDLLRALIVGPPGTPYHDGVFLFDFCLGSNYPQEPPSASYHSFGIRVNPNLYESGKVCLSLLATWAGKGSEVWDAKVSNMLQVLVSIQGLVLVDDPYYNEAGYEKQHGTEEGFKLGSQYNEQAFLGNVKTILAALRNPPAHFSELIKNHFKERGGGFLLACEAYLDGCPVGGYTPGWKDNVQNTEEESSSAQLPSSSKKQKPPPSAGFKLALQKLTPKLRVAFEENGK